MVALLLLLLLMMKLILCVCVCVCVCDEIMDYKFDFLKVCHHTTIVKRRLRNMCHVVWLCNDPRSGSAIVTFQDRTNIFTSLASFLSHYIIRHLINIKYRRYKTNTQSFCIFVLSTASPPSSPASSCSRICNRGVLVRTFSLPASG